jgi:purine-nucleoside phosphorylase
MADIPALDLAADFLRSRLHDEPPTVAIILGSGLGALAESVRGETMPYEDIPGFPATTVTGHGGELVVGSLEGVRAILQTGRFHLYEGHDPATVVRPMRLFAELGVKYVIVTNAAGGLNRAFRPPTLMLVADHINLMWRNPLLGPVAPGEHRWPDLHNLYDPELKTLARDVARDRGIRLEEGVYAAVLGPSYETPAEVRMLARIGADAVGMSTVPEAVTARARGLRVLGISSITNVAAGLSPQRLSHHEVLAAGQRLGGDLEQLIRGILRRLT